MKSPGRPGRSVIYWILLSGLLAACASADIPILITPAPTMASPAFTHTAPLPSETPSLLSPTLTLAPTVTPVINGAVVQLVLTPTEAASETPTALPTPAPTVTPPPPPTPDAQARLRTVRLPILMYHYVEPWPADADIYRQSLTVRPDDFAAQMQYLYDNGYAVVSLYDLAEALALGTPLPEKAVALTFDDGYRGLMDYALPVMQRYGFTGTVFVITQPTDFDKPQYLSWSQLQDLHALGWDIEPHTKTHDQLAGEPRDKQLYEMLGSIESIEAHIGVRPHFICYPAGKFDDVTLRLAEEMGLWGGVTTVNGRMHGFADRFTWMRVRIDGRYGLSNFIYAVTTKE